MHTHSATSLLPLLLTLIPEIYAHGNHDKQAPLGPVNPENPNDWATVHMASEHHISNFDPTSFFHLHDYDSDGIWEVEEIRRTYGLAAGSTDGMGHSGATGNPSEEDKKKVEKDILRLFDKDGDGEIDLKEWQESIKAGKRLPDFGYGPGHHGDDEFEYEIHHYERFHDENTKEEDLTHPEDIAHFRKHEEMDQAADKQAAEDKMSIVERNIPAKFRSQ